MHVIEPPSLVTFKCWVHLYSISQTYMYAGIFHLPQCTYTSTTSTPHVSRSRVVCHVIQSATIPVYRVNRYSSRDQFKDHITF